MAQFNYSIVGGPSKYELIVIGLSYGSAEKQIPVTFEISSNGPVFHELKVRITRVEREDGSGESWNFNGYVVTARPLEASGYVSGYFSTKTRKGSMEIEV